MSGPLVRASGTSEPAPGRARDSERGPRDIAAYPQTALPDRVQPTRPGLRYVERLTAEWVRALDQSKQRVELILHISAESIEELINGDAHEATIVGVARDLPRRQASLTISEGIFQVLVDDPSCVDTKLIAYRLKLTDHASDAVKIEQDLMQIVPQGEWTLFSHLLIHHGRAICTARKPNCEYCPILNYCPTGKANLREAGK